MRHKIVADGDFVKRNIERLLERFDLRYNYESSKKVTYTIFNKDKISTSGDIVLEILSESSHVQVIHISIFDPKLPNKDKLASACLYLIISHFAQMNQLPAGTPIVFKAAEYIFENFYKKLLPYRFTPKQPENEFPYAWFIGYYQITSANRFLDHVLPLHQTMP